MAGCYPIVSDRSYLQAKLARPQYPELSHNCSKRRAEIEARLEGAAEGISAVAGEAGFVGIADLCAAHRGAVRNSESARLDGGDVKLGDIEQWKPRIDTGGALSLKLRVCSAGSEADNRVRDVDRGAVI